MAARLRRAVIRTNTRDGQGTVRVQIMLINPKTRTHTTGNIVRAFHLQATTVGAVAEKIERLLHREGT